MKSRIFFILRYYLFWIAVFILQKILFMAFNFRESLDLQFIDWLRVIYHGLRLDFSAAAYLMVIPILAITILCFFEIRYTRTFLKYYNYFFLFIILYLGIADMELYSYWGFKLDITPLVYLKTPKEAAASLNFVEIGLLFILLLILYYYGLKAFRKLILEKLNDTTGKSGYFSLIGVFILGLSIIPIRGGVGIAPVNLGSAYFHSNPFANHSAINVLWNSVYSIVEKQSPEDSHVFMEDRKAENLFRNFYPVDTTRMQVIRSDANIILIILESFSNKIIGEMGGETGITPELDTLCRNSVVFKNFFSSGDRSEKGILSLLSGYPAQPTTTIIDFPGKTQKLPFLQTQFHEMGYYTAFYYGGDMNFANFRTYFTNPSMDKIVTMKDFPSALNKQKWGVPDEFLFWKMISDIDTIRKPFFISCFTLSSHEPYDIPMEPVFKGISRDDLSKNGFYYTDSCLGKFIDQAKMTDWWDNTLVIILADHGSRYPGNTQSHLPVKFHIPMIWTGGAVILPDTSINTYASQTDLPRTLLNQFGYNADRYQFSKDIFGKESNSFAMYFFNNGFGYVSDSVQAVYDNKVKKYIYTSGPFDEESSNSYKAYLQYLSRDFNGL